MVREAIKIRTSPVQGKANADSPVRNRSREGSVKNFGLIWNPGSNLFICIIPERGHIGPHSCLFPG